jgi:quinol monooxygenase YgiN
MPVGVIAKLRIKPGVTAKFEEAFVKFQQAVRSQEPGNTYFGLHRSREDACAYTVLEQYRDEAALTAHRSMPYYLAIPATFGEFMAGPPDIQVLDAVE